MPELSRFYGIVITINYREHELPHFHVKYNDHLAVFSIQELKLMTGKLPNRVKALVLEWAFEHRDELFENWELALQKNKLKKIAPLD